MKPTTEELIKELDKDEESLDDYIARERLRGRLDVLEDLKVYVWNYERKEIEDEIAKIKEVLS